jgi:translation initiation factor IF-3
VVPTEEALRLASEAGLDLVEVAPNGTPPVCKIMDFGKFKYQLSKKQRQGKHKAAEVKAIRLFPKIDDHDLLVKIKNARRFLEKGNKVQINLLFKGRESTHPEIGREVIEKIFAELEDVASPERAPYKDGRIMTALLAPTSKPKKPPAKQEPKEITAS